MALELQIVTPSGAAFQGQVDGVVLPGSEGDFGVLPEHERFLCPLRVGAVEIREGGVTRHAAIAEGFADVSGHEVAVLVDACEMVEAGELEAALERIRARNEPGAA